MPNISSPISNKNYQSSGGMKEFVIPDGEDVMPEEMMYTNVPQMHPHQHMHQHVQPQMQQQIPLESAMQMRRQSSQTNTKISDSGRKRIEMLCGMTTINKEIKIGENIFVLRSLKSKENRDCLVTALKYDGSFEFTFELRKQILARSIVSVSGIDIENFLGSYDFSAKLEFIDELDDLIIDKLYAEYLALNKEVKQKFGLETTEQIKETIEDIKK